MSELLNSKRLVKLDKIRYVSYERRYDSFSDPLVSCWTSRINFPGKWKGTVKSVQRKRSLSTEIDKRYPYRRPWNQETRDRLPLRIELRLSPSILSRACRDGVNIVDRNANVPNRMSAENLPTRIIVHDDRTDTITHRRYSSNSISNRLIGCIGCYRNFVSSISIFGIDNGTIDIILSLVITEIFLRDQQLSDFIRYSSTMRSGVDVIVRSTITQIFPRDWQPSDRYQYSSTIRADVDIVDRRLPKLFLRIDNC